MLTMLRKRGFQRFIGWLTFVVCLWQNTEDMDTPVIISRLPRDRLRWIQGGYTGYVVCLQDAASRSLSVFASGYARVVQDRCL